ncbi:MAG TPA: hypothetical protein VFF88_11070 [Methylocella sp.]|nr:hypothetical protein [Methylocella sp.]
MSETKGIMGLLRGFAGGAREGRPPVTQRDPGPVEALLDRHLLLNGRIAARLQPRNTPVKDLADVEFRVFSQWGEDGIIEWLVSHVAVPNSRFVEFGVENFSEANCRFLMFNRNWKGLVIDSNADYMRGLQSDPKLWTHDLTALPAFVTAENINRLISGAGFSGPLGILSIDVDGNDYWIWQAIDCVSPAIVICEYNSLFGDLRPLVIPYDPEFERFKAHPSGLYFGASIAALQRIAAAKGYSFIGTNSNGNNAFFVRDDLAHSVMPLIAGPKARPSRHRGGRDGQGRLTFTSGLARLERIKECEVLDVETGQMLRLSDIDPLYSGEWTAGMS